MALVTGWQVELALVMGQAGGDRWVELALVTGQAGGDGWVELALVTVREGGVGSCNGSGTWSWLS